VGARRTTADDDIHDAWFYGYDVEAKQQSSQSNSKSVQRQNKVPQSVATGKIIILAFFDYRGVLQCGFVPRGQRVNQECCLSVSRRLRETVCKKQREIRRQLSSFLSHNAPTNTALVVQKIFAKNRPLFPQSSYYLDVSPAHFFLFQKFRIILEGRGFF
jgi:hypothetical protein